MRSLKFCEICNNVIEITEFDEHTQSHKEKQAQPIKDSKLPSTVINNYNPDPNPNTSNKLDKNLNLKRLESTKITCEYCELLLPDSEFYEHDLMCGSRSTKCEYCNKNLLYKQMKSHLNDCTARLVLEQNAYEDDFSGIIYLNHFDR